LSDADDPTRVRALRFAETFDWIEPVIVAHSPADAEIVTRFGNGVVDDYHQYTIEMQWSASQRADLLARADADDSAEMERFLQGTMTVCITCNATDVISFDCPFMDLD
jgi:hypothetical protein